MGRMQGLWSYLLTLSLTARIWCSELVIQRTGLPIACLFSKRGCLLSIMIVFSVMSILSEVSEGLLFSNIDKLLFTWNGACLPRADKFKHKTWRCSLESQTEILMWRSQKGTRSFYDGERFKNCEMGDISFYYASCCIAKISVALISPCFVSFTLVWCLGSLPMKSTHDKCSNRCWLK